MTLTQNPGVGKDPVRQFCDFPALLVRGLSLCGDASRDPAVRSKREADQVGSCQLSPSFNQSRVSFNAGKQTGASFHFVWKGRSSVKKKINIWSNMFFSFSRREYWTSEKKLTFTWGVRQHSLPNLSWWGLNMSILFGALGEAMELWKNRESRVEPQGKEDCYDVVRTLSGQVTQVSISSPSSLHIPSCNIHFYIIFSKASFKGLSVWPRQLRQPPQRDGPHPRYMIWIPSYSTMWVTGE